MHLRTWQQNMATQHGNNHAAIPMRSAATDFYRKRIDLRARTRTKHLDGTVIMRVQKSSKCRHLHARAAVHEKLNVSRSGIHDVQ